MNYRQVKPVQATGRDVSTMVYWNMVQTTWFSLIFLGLWGCENDSCEQHGSWCRDGDVYYCYSEHTGGIFDEWVEEIEDNCNSSESCREWNGSEANCVPKNICERDKPICVDHETVVTCDPKTEKIRRTKCDYRMDCAESPRYGGTCAYREDVCYVEGERYCSDPGQTGTMIFCHQQTWSRTENCPAGLVCNRFFDEISCGLPPLDKN